MKKEFNWKRFWATVVIVFIAFIFTVSIFLSYSGQTAIPQDMEYIAEVNGKRVEFYGNSPVIREYERLREMYKTRTKEEILNKAVQNVVVSMLTEEFAKNNGFSLPEDFIDKVTADNVYNIARKTDITSSDIKVARLNVESLLKSSYLPTKINTFISRIPKRSQTSFYLFKTLDDLKVSMDIVEFDEVEFIRKSEINSNPKDIEAFYISNYKDMSLNAKIPITVEKLIFSDRKSAYSFISNQVENYEEKTLVKLDPEKNKNIITGLPDDINKISKPFFENRKYVIYRVSSITPFSSLEEKVKNYVSLKYVLDKYSSLQGKYSDKIKEALNNIKELLSKNDITGISRLYGVKTYRTGKFSIVKALTEYVPDTKGEALSLPRGIYDISIMVSFFKKPAGEVGIQDIDNQTKVIYKIISRDRIPSKVSEVADKIFSAYQFLYQEAIFSDWSKMIERSGDVKIKDISKFAKEL
ncbi:MAG: hypothetical protein RMJ37_04890 [Spirochaetia bacterium]|nr:hypothetical protein [Spirochaetota bacterium]MDW8112657.1 hypothetical protein [Spirochaetia bacterium]